jgi:putative DNA methylase
LEPITTHSAYYVKVIVACARSDIGSLAYGFSAEAVDRDTQTLWLWLDTFLGEQASSDDVRKLAKSLNVDPDDFRRVSLLFRS